MGPGARNFKFSIKLPHLMEWVQIFMYCWWILFVSIKNLRFCPFTPMLILTCDAFREVKSILFHFPCALLALIIVRMLCSAHQSIANLIFYNTVLLEMWWSVSWNLHKNKSIGNYRMAYFWGPLGPVILGLGIFKCQIRKVHHFLHIIRYLGRLGAKKIFGLPFKYM
jgi:hypothetical protein